MMRVAEDIVIRPIITERSMDMMAEGKYTFQVAKKVNKTEIKKAVENLFGVKVDKVYTMNMKGKKKRQGRTEGKTADWKKAIVKLKADSKQIEFFEGMQ